MNENRTNLPPDLFELAGPAPLARKPPGHRDVQAVQRADDYAWLENRNDGEVIAHLEAENAYFDRLMAPTAALQSRLCAEMKARIVEDDTSPPVRDGDYCYAWTIARGQEYRDLLRYAGTPNGPREIVLDVNAMARDRSYFRIVTYSVTKDGSRIAWLENTTGGLKHDLKLLDLRSRQPIAHAIEDADDVFWGPDGGDLYVVHQDESARPYRLDRYHLGNGEHDVLFEEADQEFALGAGLSSDRSRVIVESSATDTSEVALIDPRQPRGPRTILSPRRDRHKYSADVGAGVIYVLTDDRGLNGRIVTVPLDQPDLAWRELVPVRGDVAIGDFKLFKRFMVLETRRRSQTEIEIRSLAGGETHAIQQDEAAYALRPAGNREYDTDVLRYAYSSYTAAGSIYDYDMAARRRTLIKEQRIPGGYDPTRYAVSRMVANAADGTEIPVDIVRDARLSPNGARPTLLYVYGAYGIPMDPAFVSSRISLLDRGVVFACAHIRGGGDQGRLWHEAGRLEKKANSFTDTNAAAHALIAAGWTAPAHLAIEGGSAGGLTLGAAINLEPELYRVAHLAVPFLDVLNTMLDDSLPLTTGEYREWGNPNEREAFLRILSYSPYDNLKSAAYPMILATTGINDMQVRYSEPAKYVAKLRALNPHAKIAMRIDMGVGHGGASGRYAKLAERAQELAFILWGLGIQA